MDKYVQACLDMVRQQDRARYLTTLYAPPAARPKLWALHAFNLELARISDTVSEPMIGEIRLTWWQETVESLYAGTARKHDVAEALALLVQNVPQTLLLTMIDGRTTDIYQGYLGDFDALEQYARQTGGAQQQAVMHILGVRDDGLHEMAAHIGIAWTLTGLVRAISFHASMQRVYLPEQDLAALGISRESLFQRAIGADIIPLVTRMIQRAQALLVAQIAASPAALPGLLLGTLARDYCTRIEKAGFDVTRADLDAGDVTRQIKLFWASLRRRY
jgi:NADH dehydrogenase [ubiquinone] 1 alpha subcomplex assembly factor 6